MQIQDPVPFASNRSSATAFKGFWTAAKDGTHKARIFCSLVVASARNYGKRSPRTMLNWKEIREETE